MLGLGHQGGLGFQGGALGQINLLSFPNDLSNAAWMLNTGGTGVVPVVTGNFGVAPNGTTTAARVQLDKGAGVGFSRIQQSITAAFATYQGAIWLKTNDASVKQVAFRMDANVVTVAVNGTWRRFFALAGAPTTTPNLQLLLWDVASTDNTADLLAWGAVTARVGS